jgi:hypothetical protein
MGRGGRVLLVILSLVSPVAAGASSSARTPITGAVSDPGTPTAEDRRELAERRTAVVARVEEFRQRLVAPCANLRDAVRGVLESVERVGAVDPGPALLASNPPKLRVSYVVVLTSGRRAHDEVVVEVPLDVRLVPAADPAGPGSTHRCGSAVTGR